MSRLASLLCVTLNPGVRQIHFLAFSLLTFFTISSFVLINAAQPFVLRLLGIDEGKHGKTTGDITLYGEIVIICASHLLGSLSDRVGRKLLYIFGFFCTGIGLMAYPHATSLSVLILLRCFFSLGAASLSSMITPLIADYVAPEQKGKGAGYAGLAAGMGAVFSAVGLLQVPAYLVKRGLSEEEAGRWQFYIAGLDSGVAILIAVFLLKNVLSSNSGGRKMTTFELMKEGAMLGWRDKSVGLCYFAGFCARGDSVILTTFLSLWVSSYAVNTLGYSWAKAASTSGMITGIAQLSSLVFAPLVGRLTDRADRRLALCFSGLSGAVSYGAMAFVGNPTSTFSILIAAAVGISEISLIVTSQSLVAERSSKRVRGSIGGVMGLCGSLGIIIASQIGGALYDLTFYGGPFFLFGIFNFIVFVGSLLSLKFEPNLPPVPTLDGVDGDDDGLELIDEN